MKHFFVISNQSKDVNHEIANKIKQEILAQDSSATVVLFEPEREGATLPDCIPQETEGILVLGGDGTLLQVAKEIEDREIPLLGVNLGTLGYLAEVEVSGIESAVQRLLSNQYVIEERMMLAGTAVCGGKEQPVVNALNDVVLSRRGDLQIIGYRVYVNHMYLNDFYADGIILSTPTGSTGYNLSAGGSIVEPKAKLMVLTPVCPHTLNTRSIMLSPDDTVEVEVLLPKGEKEVEVGAYFDGGSRVILSPGDKVVISRSPKVTKIVKISDVGFLEVLHKKMSE